MITAVMMIIFIITMIIIMIIISFRNSYILYINTYTHTFSPIVSMSRKCLYTVPIVATRAADLGFNFKGCTTSGQVASINGTRGLRGVLSSRSQCI